MSKCRSSMREANKHKHAAPGHDCPGSKSPAMKKQRGRNGKRHRRRTISDEQKTGLTHVRIVVLCFLMLFLDGIDNLGIAYVAPALSHAWHLTRGALGPVFTAGVAGVAIGALVTGPIADRFGRRPTTIVTVIYFALLTLLVTQASNLTELIILRFFAGLGLGSLVPMAVVIASEFAPRRTRARLVTLASCGYAIGAASGGLIAAQIVPIYGWQGMFYLGGVLPLFLAAAMYLWLPEFVRLQALRPGNDASIARTLATINPALSFPSDVKFTLVRKRPPRRRASFNFSPMAASPSRCCSGSSSFSTPRCSIC